MLFIEYSLSSVFYCLVVSIVSESLSRHWSIVTPPPPPTRNLDAPRDRHRGQSMGITPLTSRHQTINPSGHLSAIGVGGWVNFGGDVRAVVSCSVVSCSRSNQQEKWMRTGNGAEVLMLSTMWCHLWDSVVATRLVRPLS